MHTPHPTPLDPPLAISYVRNHQKSLAYFSHLAPLVFFFFAKRQSQKGGAMAQYLPPSILSCLRACEQIISSFKGDEHVYKRRFGHCVLC